MFFPTTLTVLLALAPATLFAAPTRTLESRTVAANDLGSCDLSKVVLPTAPTPLPQPSAGLTLQHIAIGRGTQNYTCASSSSTSTPVQVGANASLFNVTCDSTRLGTSALADVSRMALNYPIPTDGVAAQRLSGHHQFSAQGVPQFIMQSPNDDFGTTAAKVVTKSAPPKTADPGTNGFGSVPWLQLAGVSGTFKEIYRVNTAGGSPPPNCQGMSAAFQVEYSAEYWFYA